MRQGAHCQIGQYAVIADDVRLGNHVFIGNNVTIYPNVTIEDDSRIMDGAVIGRLTYRTSSVTRPTPSTFQPLRIGPKSVIGCNVVLYTGVTLGQEVLLADGVSLREGCILSDHTFLGRFVTVNYNTTIGARTRIMDLCHITGNASIGEDCFISVLVGTANDNDIYLRRFGLHDTTQDVLGPTIGHYVVLGNGVLLNPGIHIGDGALVGTGSVATRDIGAWTIALGVPARAVQKIPADWRRKILDLAATRGQTLEEPDSAT